MKIPVTVFAMIMMLAATASAELPSATAKVVNQALSSGKSTLIDFGLRTCNVCKKMAPSLESVASEYRGQAHILFVDVRADQSIAEKFRVQMLPTQIFFNAQGEEVQRHTGYLDKEGIIAGLKSAGIK